MATNNTAAKPIFEVSELEYLLWNMLNNSDGMTGYDATKVTSANYDKFSHQQVYRTLKRRDGELWTHTLVPQEGKPDKKVYMAIDNYTLVVDYRHMTINTLILAGTKEIIEGYIEFKEKAVETLVEENRNDAESNVFLADSDVYNYRTALIHRELAAAYALIRKMCGEVEKINE